ncbi:PREDICTED: hemicentin-1-like [Amphimedon queenslandica]|uniref:Protein-tyrosine-phosphatase n=1 Tax=Amphimedon queenslandica TaxID=400682 RepID=A0AAN0J336_AMPQE|nr:PREDICTED: hemicentin-1-like [Amphimedon queenslandica]|eukprot:XP_019851148.1 PREDICTED: hemicentin-1-like [Amphimedon queenslandica]
MSLLFLLSLVLHVSCQPFFGSLPPRPTTGVRLFLGEENVTIANFSMIAAGLFHDNDLDQVDNDIGTGSPDGQNDGLWCQSSLNQNMIGTWYYPDGTTVPLGSGSPLFANNTATGQIGLLRNGGLGNIQGLYSCVIPNGEGIDQTLYVATYGNGDFLNYDELPVIDGSGSSFQLLSSVDADPPVFSLSFNVTNRSPTIVICSVDNGNQFNVSDNDLIRTVTPVNNDVQVQVSVILRMRVSGLYKCSVTTDRITTTPLVSTNMVIRNVTVTGSPSNLTYSRISLLSVTLGWSPSAVISATPQYHVFVNNSNGIIMNNNTTNTELSLSLSPDDEYNIRLVATGEDLPSEIITVTIPQTDPIVSIFSSQPVFAGQSYSLNCTVTIVAGDLNITWFDGSGIQLTEGNGISFNLVTVSDTVQRYDLIFHLLNYADIGEYFCQASLTVDGDGVLFNGTGSANTTVSIRIPLPQVSISPDGNFPLIRGTVRTVSCSVVFTPPLPTNPNVSFTVFKDNDQLSVENSSRVIAVQTGTTGALTFQPLNFSDAGNYTCTATARDSANNPLIIPSSASDQHIATIQAIPVPNITFTTTTGRSLGESLTLNCTVDVLDDLYNINVTSSIVRNGELITSTTRPGDTTAMIMIHSIRSSDAGDYQCIVNITQSDIDYEFNGMETAQVILTLPTPSAIVEYNATGHLVDGELAEGQFLDIMCIADISQYIDTSVSVTMSWRRNNTVLTNGSDFTISPPVMTNNQYTGVLRINSLRDEVDNGASYNCSVSVTPNTLSIIAGNDNSSAVTLTVARFDINHVDISINIPSVPVSGDVFNLSCVIVVPPNFVENFTSVRWTYDLEASQDVTSENNDATLVPVVRNGNIFTSVLTLDPVKTTDARQYYCQATILVFGIVDRTNRDLTVQISPPNVSIVADPPTGPIYESTGYILTCTATVNTTIVDTLVTGSVVWTDPSGNVIPTNEARRQVIPPTGNSLVSMLLFLPIDTGLNNDGGTYTCQMIINSGYAYSMIVSSQPTDTTLAVTVESLPPMTVNFSSVGSVGVGQSLTITCTITTVERLVVTPMVTFTKINDTDMEMLSNLHRPYSITTDDTGSVTNYTLILDPVRFEDAGMYTCMAEFNVTGFNNTNDPSTATYDYQEASDAFNLTVTFPPVLVTISKEHDDTLYAGTPFFIKCDIMLNPLVTIPVTVTNQWTRDVTNVPMGSSDATITESLNMINTLHYNATLMFYPLDNADDSGVYACNIEVTAPNSYTYLRNTSASTNTSITVLATPVPVVEIVYMGMAEPGEEYMLNCTVTIVDRLIVSPVITWTKRSANNVISVPPDFMIVSNVMSSLYLNFSSLNTSDAGLYTCEASINVSQISIVARSNGTSNLPLEIPIPSVDVSRSKKNYFFAGSNLILTCDISVDPNVDTPFTVNVTWNMTDQPIMSSGDFATNPNSMRLADTNRVNISSVMMRSGFNEYRSTLNFTTLSSIEDSGTYTCIVTIVPDPAYEYVMTSDTNYMNVTLTVTNPLIGGFSTSPNSFLGLEASCPDSDPYDNFILTCTATKPTIVIPNLVIAWTHNGTIETGTVTTTAENMTTTVTNTLSFSASRPSDSGTYRCTASITIPDSTDIATSEESTVAIRSQSLPVAATNVMATPGNTALNATTAAISFIIPNIAYTPEAYSVKYTGMTFQTTEQTSMIRMSSDDITATNQEFTIMLTGLEEDNTYTYTVDSTNCLGTTSTVQMSFSTLPTLPMASPMNCSNITFFLSNVTLTWTAPPLIDQNGGPVGYNLTCMNTNGVSVNGLIPTRSSTDTMFTITDVMPFTVWYKKKSKKFDINKANELSVAPNAGYGLVAIANTSATQNNEGMYERIDEYLYEPIDDKVVQQKEEDTPIVGDSVDNIPIANCPAYATSPITAQTSSPNQGETNEEQDVDEYENMS